MLGGFKNMKLFVGVVGVVIPVVVGVLFFLPFRLGVGSWVGYLPAVNAVLNSLTSLCLLVSLWAILRGRVGVHKRANLVATFLGLCFLVLYVIYHFFSESKKYGDVNGDGVVDVVEKGGVGYLRYVYYGLLLSHILLAVVVVPYVLLSLFYGLSGDVGRHKKISRRTWGIWFYVSVSGVLVYLMIRRYY